MSCKPQTRAVLDTHTGVVAGPQAHFGAPTNPFRDAAVDGFTDMPDQMVSLCGHGIGGGVR
ncbi:hypothetical protein Lfu02_77630 [Longispora fulva]|uniref:Uncharacterized protein n=1 Tax=Longispora fulva TaxID=619741 RepID=A0A8J7GEG5_9ACTN|nr:hypothetical protein [Longispora fulva]GIG63391.1 hypothetical protein Lfu02_77630 [Longispora fulva]